MQITTRQTGREVAADPRSARAREVAAGVAQYGLLFGFAAVAAAISAHGLFGFARANMGLRGPWPYLLWGALDGAAGMCAVLLLRRAARGESAVAPRLAVWGLVAASGWFNWTHAPAHPGAREAFALMPVIAATLFEFSLRETRHLARGTGRQLAALGWLHPAERLRAWLLLAADESISAGTATYRVRVDHAARCLHVLRQTLAVRDRAAMPATVTAHRVRRAERRSQAALIRVRFADPCVAAEVLRQVQVLTLTRALAGLDYRTPDHAQAALASLITNRQEGHLASNQAGFAASARRPGVIGGAVTGFPAMPDINGTGAAWPSWTAPGCQNGHPPGAGQSACDQAQTASWPAQHAPTRGDGSLVDAAARIVAGTRAEGGRLSQAELARRLRAEGHSIANGRLRWLSAVSGLLHQTETR